MYSAILSHYEQMKLSQNYSSKYPLSVTPFARLPNQPLSRRSLHLVLQISESVILCILKPKKKKALLRAILFSKPVRLHRIIVYTYVQ